jgi:hypothetical protein
MIVDTALSEVPVNVTALIDDTDFKTKEESVAYNATGMDLVWNFVTTGGVFTQTAVTPTTAGTHDWTHQGNGMYTLEIPASSGTINNDTEGYGWFTGVCDGVLPWAGPQIEFVPANIGNSLVNGTDTLQVDLTQVNGATTPVTNLEDDYDGTGYTKTNSTVGTVSSVTALATAAEDSLVDKTWDEAKSGHVAAGSFGEEVQSHSTSDEVAGIGASSSGALKFEVTDDNTGGAIKGVTFVGTQGATTFANTEAEDGTYHTITHATNAFDLVYEFNVGGGRQGVECTFKGYMTGITNTADIQVYDFVGTDWETVQTIPGQPGTDNITLTFALLSKHTGSGADLGNVLVRLVTTGQTAPVLNVDQILVDGVSLGQSVGYEGGAVWLDTNASNTSTANFVDGTADNPVSTIGAARTLADSLNLKRIQVLPGSSITLGQSFDSFEFDGFEYSVALGSQSIEGARFVDATISGVGTATTTPPEFVACSIGTATLPPSTQRACIYTATMTLGSAGDYFLINGRSGVAGTGAPSISVNSLGAGSTLNIRSWSGGLTMTNCAAGFVSSVEMENGGTCSVNGTGGSVYVRGRPTTVTDASGGSVTVDSSGVVNRTTVNAEADTALTDYAPSIKSETDTQFSDIKGAGWVATDNLALIRDDSTNILLDTAELVADDTPTAIAAVQAAVDAIKLVTDLLPDGGALTTIDANITSTETKVDGVKAKTDSLTFIGTRLTAHIKGIGNDAATVTGAGTALDPWGP